MARIKVADTRASQREPMRADQKKMDSGGYGWEVDGWSKLHRFLMLGIEGGTFYVSERKLTRENATSLFGLIKADGQRVVQEIADIAKANRAHRKDPTFFALAACAAMGDEATKDAAFQSLGEIARIPTNMFSFVRYFLELKGNHSLGRKARRAIAAWYNDKDPERLAFLLSKYQQREGWSHKDILRMAHVRPDGDERNNVLAWSHSGAEAANLDADYMKTIKAFEWAKKAEKPEEIVQLIHEADLSWEHVPSQFLKEPDVWRALVPKLGMTALLRNLNKLPLEPMSDIVQAVVERLTDEEQVRKGRLHPMQILTGLKTYAQGKGFKGSKSWGVNRDVVDALDRAFYLSYGNLQATGKRVMLLVDVSGSMGGGWGHSGQQLLSPRESAAAVSLVLKVQEGANAHIWGFSHKLVELDISPRDRLDTVVKKMSSIPFGNTDASVGIRTTEQRGIDVDAFVCLTDNESWCGPEHVAQSINRYRQKVGHDVAFVSVAFAANKWSLADPLDRRMLDVVGFDSALPQLITGFMQGDF